MFTQTLTEGQSGEDAGRRVFKPRREASEGTGPANNLISSLQNGDNRCLLLKPPSLWSPLWQPELTDNNAWSEATQPQRDIP